MFFYFSIIMHTARLISMLCPHPNPTQYVEDAKHILRDIAKTYQSSHNTSSLISTDNSYKGIESIAEGSDFVTRDEEDEVVMDDGGSDMDGSGW